MFHGDPCDLGMNALRLKYVFFSPVILSFPPTTCDRRHHQPIITGAIICLEQTHPDSGHISPSSILSLASWRQANNGIIVTFCIL